MTAPGSAVCPPRCRKSEVVVGKLVGDLWEDLGGDIYGTKEGW